MYVWTDPVYRPCYLSLKLGREKKIMFLVPNQLNQKNLSTMQHIRLSGICGVIVRTQMFHKKSLHISEIQRAKLQWGGLMILVQS